MRCPVGKYFKKLFGKVSAYSETAQPENHDADAPLILCTDLLSPPHNIRHYVLIAPAAQYEADFRRQDVLICAAMAAKTIGLWWSRPPQRGIIAAASRSDKALLASYKNLGWQIMSTADHDLLPPHIKNNNADICYFIADNNTLQQMALLLTHGTSAVMKEPMVQLQEAGVSPKHLAAIARGHTNRRLLEMAYDDDNSIGNNRPQP